MIIMKKVKNYLPWVLTLAVIVGGVYWLVTVEPNGESATVRLGEEIPIVSRDHIEVGDEHPGYNSNPPTSGAHAGAAPWGFNTEEIADENAIHNLEHGGIWVSYKDIDEESLEKLKAIAAANSQSVVVSPRADNDSPIAIASWGRLIKTDVVDEVLINEFIRVNKNNSPERLAH